MAKKLKVPVAEVEVQPDPQRPGIFKQVVTHLEQNDWAPVLHEDKGYMTMVCRLHDGNVRLNVYVQEHDNWQQVLVRLAYPVVAPRHRRAAVCEALSVVNVSQRFGSMEMDPSDGEIYVRTVVESTNGMDDELLARVLNANLRMADRHLAALLAVAFGNAAPSTVTDLANRAEAENLQ
jgi:hypothetical protein